MLVLFTQCQVVCVGHLLLLLLLLLLFNLVGLCGQMLVQVGKAAHDRADVLVHDIFDDLIGVGHLVESAGRLFFVVLLLR